MYTAKVEKSHVKVNGGGEVFHRLAEPQAKARKTAQVATHN
jgi:hypothetical protein